DSCSLLRSFLGDLIKGASVAVERRRSTREAFPPEYRHVNVLGVDIDGKADPACAFGGDEAAARSEKGVIQRLAWLRVVHDRTSHQFHRLLGPVAGDLVFRVAVSAERIEVRDLPH